MSTLTLDSFSEFVRAAHGWEPFPWQADLVAQIAARGRWPEAVDVPTGLGKTSIIDAFVFLSAFRPDLARTRLFFVVDRRVVVDEAFEHARALADALRHNERAEVVAAVAQELQRHGTDSPLEVTRMRGGITWAWRWLDRPDQPAVVVGTVAQLGSRLFFRGHGVSEYRRSIDAALVGTDSVIVMDEAHLAGPMLDSLGRAMELDGKGEGLIRGPVLVTMSATSNRNRGWTHRWSEADAKHPEAGKRLAASKRLTTAVVETSKAKADAATTDAMASLAQALVERGARRVGVVANTVARARLVYERLERIGGLDASLLTGRMREFDRQEWRRLHYGPVKAGSGEQLERPVVVVATQTIEVGVNLDFDGMVTESASLDAVVQRLGRLNRLGRFDGADPMAVVVHDSSVTAEDPVYQSARVNTWDWLSSTCAPQVLSRNPPGAVFEGGIDAGPSALRVLVDGIDPNDREGMVRPPTTVPVLTAERLACFARTCPPPDPDLDVTPFLYGFRDEAPEVTVVWRAGLGDDSRGWSKEVDLAPPASSEGLELPLPVVRRWLRGQAGTGELGDGPVSAGDPDRDGGGKRLLMRDREGEWQAHGPGELRPNAIIVVPVEYGGWDEFGWAPASKDDVLDAGPLVDHRGTRVVRLGPALANVFAAFGQDVNEAVDALVAKLRHEDADHAGALIDFVKAARAEVGGLDAEHPVSKLLDALSGAAHLKVVNAPTTAAVAVCTAHGAATTAYAEDTSEAGSSVINAKVELGAHQKEVAALAEAYARNLGLDRVAASIGRAALEHDEGKRDSRFQVMLHGGDRLMAEASAVVLAKSGMDPADRAAFRRAAALSGYPTGMRHEALSARIVASRLSSDPDEDLDADLVVHLAASHHGRSRPLLPPIPDDHPVEVQVPGVGEPMKSHEVVDWEAPARFKRLNERYGYWGLALCEAILRLADMKASESPSEVISSG
jgi:CRISPR-associated endonuclease/helicase Cas3